MSSDNIRVYRPIELSVDTNIYNKPIVVIENPHDIAFTDGKVIYINIPLIENILDSHKLGREAKERVFQEVINYLVAHETMHIIFTDFPYYRKFIEIMGRIYDELLTRFFRVVFNILEDARIEYFMEIYYPALLESFKMGRKLLFEEAMNRELRYVGSLDEKKQIVLLLLRFLHIFVTTQDIEKTMSGLQNSTNKQDVVEALWEEISDIIPSIIASRISNDPKYTVRLASIIAIRFKDELSKIHDFSYMIRFLQEMAKRSMIYIINQMIKKLKRSTDVSKLRAGGYSELIPVISSTDYSYYQNIVAIYSSYIRELREKILKVYRAWREERKYTGNIVEDYLVDVYVWSYTKDEPRPKIFESMESEMRSIDVLLLIDQSGSMAEAENLAASSAIIITEALRPAIMEDIVRLGIAGFGDYLVYYKRVSWPISIARVLPRSEGGTMAFKALKLFFDSEKHHLRRDTELLIIFFTDSYDAEEDLEIANSVADSIRRFNAKAKFLGFITENHYDADFVSHLDAYRILESISELPAKMIDLILELTLRRRKPRVAEL